jgi:hypothetical protein
MATLEVTPAVNQAVTPAVQAVQSTQSRERQAREKATKLWGNQYTKGYVFACREGRNIKRFDVGWERGNETRVLASSNLSFEDAFAIAEAKTQAPSTKESVKTGEILPPETPVTQAVTNEATAFETNATSKSILGWSGYNGSQLHSIVLNAIDELKILTRKGRKELQERLLPALHEIKRRLKNGEEVAGHTSIKDYMESVGLTDSVVRGWEFRMHKKELQVLLPEPTAGEPEPTLEEIAEVCQKLENSVEPTDAVAAIEEDFAAGNFQPATVTTNVTDAINEKTESTVQRLRKKAQSLLGITGAQRIEVKNTTSRDKVPVANGRVNLHFIGLTPKQVQAIQNAIEKTR